MSNRFLSRLALGVTLLCITTIQTAGNAGPLGAREASRVLSILTSQGFTSSTDAGTQLTYIGRICGGSACFEVYYYDHTNIHPVQIGHGIQKLIILKNGTTYVGSYLIDVDDGVPSASGTAVQFKLPAGRGNLIPFGKNGPPLSAWINGSNLTLER